MSAESNSKSPSQVIAELLLRNGVLTREQLQRALAEARSTGRGLTYTLVSLGLVPEVALLRLLSQIYRVKAFDLSKIERIDPSLLGVVSAEVAGRALVLPLHRNADTLIVAMANPANRTALLRLGRATGLKIQPVVATEFALRNAIAKHYGKGPPKRQETATEQRQQKQRQASGKLRFQTRAQPPVAGPATVGASPAQPPSPAVVPAPAIPPVAEGPASASSPAPAAPSPGDEPQPDELNRKRVEAELALSKMSMRKVDMFDIGDGMKLILIGAAMLIGGGIITWLSYNSAGEGGSYVVTTGLFIGGAILVFKGLIADWNP